ncbi:MAG: hypothetical protein GEU91_13595 [Rhizobiales bacterium]|nr:hypothetical protein [Hyphomicrobiales bacterium]
MSLVLPRLPRGRPTSATLAAYDDDLRQFCGLILEINSTLDFQIGAREWCYLLEEHGLGKGDFDAAQEVLTECRRRRLLPMDLVAEDGARSFDNLDDLDDDDPEAFAQTIVDYVTSAHRSYTPFSAWDGRDYYLEMVVEKLSLKSLFGPIAEEFSIPIANGKGWSDMNLRWGMLGRLRRRAAEGKHSIILYFGDHDPYGLNISNSLRKNLADLLTHSEWLRLMDHLTIDRFGLNYDFIQENNLTWIDNLETGSGRSLADERHKDHKAEFVQRYLREFGARKVEASALVKTPEASRALCREAILKYLPDDALGRYREALAPHREQVRAEIQRLLEEAYQ